MEFVRNGIIIGPLYLHYYGVCIILGALAAAWIGGKAGIKRGFKPDQYWDMLPWALIFGIIGARLWHVLMPSVSSGINFQYYIKHPAEIIAVWNGGLGIPGGILGGIFGIWLFCRKNKLSFAPFIDTVAVGLPVGQAIGRLGNYVNQELYGRPTNLPWAITIEPAYRLAPYLDQATYHPLFLYEALYNLAVFALLWTLDHKRDDLCPGSLLFLYLIAYPVGRFLLEFLRLDTAMVGGINMNQIIMAVTAILSACALICNQRRSPRS